MDVVRLLLYFELAGIKQDGMGSTGEIVSAVYVYIYIRVPVRNRPCSRLIFSSLSSQGSDIYIFKSPPFFTNTYGKYPNYRPGEVIPS